MPRASEAGASNAGLAKVEAFMAQEAEAARVRAEEALAAIRGGEPSTDASQEPSSSQDSASAEAGISSSTSGDKPDKSGDSTTDTESSLQSPAPSAENLSKQDLPADPAQSSTASSTDGSTQETGPSQQSPLTSLAESPAKSEATTAQPSEVPVAVQKALGVESPVTLADQRAGVPAPMTAEQAANDLITLARDEYNNKNYDVALKLVDDAQSLFPGVADIAEQARTAITAAKGFAQ